MSKLTERLGRVLSGSSNSQKKEIMGLINSAMVEYKTFAKKDGLGSAVYSAYLEIDRQVAKVVQPEPISCKAGCSHCCHQEVLMTADEAEFITDNLKLNPDIKPNYLLAAAQVNLAHKDYLGAPLSLTKCMFLGDDKKCTIYEVRPAMCRLLQVITPPEDCKMDELRQVGMVFNWQAEVMASAVLSMSEGGSIPKMILKKGIE